MIALTALGNRIWGEGSHLIGAILMTMGLWVGSDKPLIAIPLLFAAVYFFRMFASAPWLNLETDNHWDKAIIRSLALTPLIMIECYFLCSLLPILIGLLAILGISASYHYSAKQKKVDPTALAEFISGAFIGVI